MSFGLLTFTEFEPPILIVIYLKVILGSSLFTVFRVMKLSVFMSASSTIQKSGASKFNTNLVKGTMMVKYLLNISDSDTFIAI